MENLSPKLSHSNLLAPDSGSILQRELDVLGTGGAEGIGRGLKMSLLDLSNFGSNLCSHPIDALGGFVKDHWSEAAVAAGIAVLAPRKHLNALLIAASSRGVVLSTLDGAISAADKTQDISAVRERFAGNLSSETRNLMNSLPMTLAGGAAGRSLANATFGKNLGALDLATGKVTMAEVQSNLLRAREQMFPPKAKLAVFDLDGTLVSTSRQLAQSIELGKKQLASSTGLGEEVVSNLMNEQFSKLKSFVNPWTVELALSEKLNVGKPQGMSFEQFRNTVSEPYWKVFKDTLKTDLKVYEGAHATLDALSKENVPAMIYTNSPAVGAVPRLEVTGLGDHVSKTVMLDNAIAPKNLAPELLRHGQDRLGDGLFSDPTFSAVGRNLAKPNPEFLLREMKQRGLRPNQVMVIGDSLESDMLLAQKSGTRGLWARWNEADALFDAKLNQVTGGNFPPAKTTGIPFEQQLMSVDQVLKHLRPPRDISGLLSANASLPRWTIPLSSYGLASHPEKP